MEGKQNVSFDEIAAIQNVSATFQEQFEGKLTHLRLIWWAIGRGKLKRSKECVFNENDLELIEPQKVSTGYREVFEKSWENKRILNPMGILINSLKRAQSEGYIGKLKFMEKGDIKFSFTLNYDKWIQLIYSYELMGDLFDNIIETTVNELTIKEAKKYAKQQTDTWAKNEKQMGTTQEEIDEFYNQIYKGYYLSLLRFGKIIDK